MPTAQAIRSKTSAARRRSSSSTAPADLVTPRHLSVPDYTETLGPEVAAIATLAGFPPDPEQRLLLDAAFAFDPKTGRSVAFEVVVIAPRQNLKTGFFKQVALGQLFVRQEPLVVWSAHEFDTASEALIDMEALIDGSDLLRRRVKLTNRGTVGNHGAVPYIQLLPKYGGARLKFKTRTSGGGRGLSGRKVFLDEGYALQPGQVGALMPVMMAQPDPQLYVGSSACRPESAVLWDYIERGRASAADRAAGDPGEARMVFAEWCAPPPEEACDLGGACDHIRTTPGCGCDKPDLIRQAHSAITRGRILIQTVVDMRTLPPGEYAREIMGWHDEPEMMLSIFAAGAWAACAVDTDPPPPAALGVAADLDQTWLALGAASTGEPVHLGSVLRMRAEQRDEFVAEVKRIQVSSGRIPVAIDKKGPAAFLIDDLDGAGVQLTQASFDDFIQACADLRTAVETGAVEHGNYDDLNAAVDAAGWRKTGDRRVFARKNGDISSLEAVALARWMADALAYDVLESFI